MGVFIELLLLVGPWIVRRRSVVASDVGQLVLVNVLEYDVSVRVP